MSRRSFTAGVILVAVFLSTAAALAGREEPSPVVSRLLAEADRYAGKGQYRTAIKIYQAVVKGSGAVAIPASALLGWGVSHFHLGEYREAVEKLGPLLIAPPDPVLPTDLVRLYLGYSLARLGLPEDAAKALGGATGTPGGETTALGVGRLLAVALSGSGREVEAFVFWDRVYRETEGGEDRRRALDLFSGLDRINMPQTIMRAVQEGRLSDAAEGILIPWISRCMDEGRWEEAGDLVRRLGEAVGADDGLRQALVGLRQRLAAPREKAPVRIGVLVPLSGTYQYFGRKVAQAYELARARAGDLKAEFLVRDTGSDTEAGWQAAKDLIERDHVVAILGPVLSAEAQKVIRVADAAMVPVLSPAAQAPGLPAASTYFFRNCLTLQQQGRHMARAAVRDLGLRKFAVLSPGDNYGQALSRSFWDEIIVLGGQIIASAEYKMEQTDFNREIRLLKGEEQVRELKPGEEEDYQPPYEAVYLPDTFNRVGLIAPQLSFHDIDRQEVTILGGSGLNSPDFVRIGEEYIEGTIFLDGFFSGSSSPEARDFVTRYRARFGETPDVMAAQAYDAASIILWLLRGGRRTPGEIREGLAALKDFPGICGATSMDPDGESIREPVYITIFRGRLVELILGR